MHTKTWGSKRAWCIQTNFQGFREKPGGAGEQGGKCGKWLQIGNECKNSLCIFGSFSEMVKLFQNKKVKKTILSLSYEQKTQLSTRCWGASAISWKGYEKISVPFVPLIRLLNQINPRWVWTIPADTHQQLRLYL